VTSLWNLAGYKKNPAVRVFKYSHGKSLFCSNSNSLNNCSDLPWTDFSSVSLCRSRYIVPVDQSSVYLKTKPNSVMYTVKMLFSSSNKIISITVIGALDLSIVSLDTWWPYNLLFSIWNKMADKPEVSLWIGVNLWYV